ncbi:MAG: hypothetical protein HYT89_02475 [Candidatus Omnitrophica bacterium]|nr:hypothetical protein [Candidatus Omnitrophota bacterium]
MRHTFTKIFCFSASAESHGRVTGHNYKLGVTVDGLEENAEGGFEEAVQKALIEKIHSRDLGTDVDFLKGKALGDQALLEIFGGIIQKIIAPLGLRSLTLERDERTIRTLIFLPEFPKISHDR